MIIDYYIMMDVLFGILFDGLRSSYYFIWSISCCCICRPLEALYISYDAISTCQTLVAISTRGLNDLSM